MALAPKTRRPGRPSETDERKSRPSQRTAFFADNRPGAIAQRILLEAIRNSPRMATLARQGEGIDTETEPHAPPKQHRLLDGPAPSQRAIVQRCKSVADVLGDESDLKTQRTLLLAYLEELDDSIGGFLADETSDVVFDITDDIYTRTASLKDALNDDRLETVAHLSDLIDDATEEYRALKDRTHPRLPKREEDESKESKQVSSTTEGFDAEIAETDIKRLKLKGNSRPLRKATENFIKTRAQTIRGLKQALLNDGTSGAASITLTQAYAEVKALVTQRASGGDDAALKEYWTMKRGGLVENLRTAEQAFAEGLTCNEELAGWLEAFLENEFEYF